MYTQLEKIFNFSKDVIIKDVKNTQKSLNLYIETKKKNEICPCCNSNNLSINCYKEQKVKDISILDTDVFFIIKKRRYICNDCSKTFYEVNNLIGKSQRMTKRMFYSIYELLAEVGSYTGVGKVLGISTNTVIRAFDKIKYPNSTLENTKVLSIDEFKGNTRGEKYNCILADPKTKRVLDILPKRHNNYLTGYFKNISKDIRKNIKCFVSDMWKPYKDISDVFFKEAKFIVDKYHWIRQVIWAFENVRKEEQKKFYKKYRRYFKKSKMLLTKRFEFLSEEEKQQVNIMLYKSDDIRIAHNLKEEFLKILDCENREEAKKKISDWILYAQNSGLKAFKKCSDTMIKWSNGVLNSFDVTYTNGFIEGCNNKIKVLKRNAYGYRNFERFRNRILHIFNYKKENIYDMIS